MTASIADMTKEELNDKCKSLLNEIDHLHSEMKTAISVISSLDTELKDSENDISQMHQYARGVLKLKSKYISELAKTNHDLKASISTSCISTSTTEANQQPPQGLDLQHVLIDPPVYLRLEGMCRKIQACTELTDKMQRDNEAWKSTADSQVGNRVIARIRKLQQENEELAKQKHSGRTAKLESEIALRTSLSDILKRTSTDVEEVVSELDQEEDSFQQSIELFHRQLALSKHQIDELTAELELHEPGVAKTILLEHNWLVLNSEMEASAANIDMSDQQNVEPEV